MPNSGKPNGKPKLPNLLFRSAGNATMSTMNFLLQRPAGASPQQTPQLPPINPPGNKLSRSKSVVVSAVVRSPEEQEALLTKATYKRSRNLLNKLTPENFEQLAPNFISLPLIDNEERMSKFVAVMFEKAIERPSASTQAYARMVDTICKASPEVEETSTKFAKHILRQYVAEFTTNVTIKKDLKKVTNQVANNAKASQTNLEQLKSDLEKKMLCRKGALAKVVGLFGELYMVQILKPKTMVARINSLINTLHSDDQENLECLCILLTLIGERLDLQLENAPGGSWDGVPFVPEVKWMDNVFKKLQELSKNKKIKMAAGLRSSILGLLELRRNGWRPKVEGQHKVSSAGSAKSTTSLPKAEVSSWNICHNNTLPPIHIPTSVSVTPVPEKKSEAPLHSSSTLNPAVTVTGLSTCEEVLDTEMKTAALTLQRLHRQGSIGNLEEKLGLLKYIRECAQTIESLASLRNANPKSIDYAIPQESAKDNDWNELGKLHYSDSNSINLEQEFANFNIGGSARSHILRGRSLPVNLEGTVVNGVVAHCPRDTFQEFLGCRNFTEVFGWVKTEFLGNRTPEFIDTLSRQVVESSKEAEPRFVAAIIRLLISRKEVRGKEVMQIMAQGVIKDLPVIIELSPKGPSNLAKLLVELFSEHTTLDWLLEVGDVLRHTGNNGDLAWRALVANCLNCLQLKKGEEHLHAAFDNTERNLEIPVDVCE